MATRQTTIVSCPGKVLLSGGYLVLDRSYAGVVVGTSSRFYTLIKPTQSNAATDSRYHQIHLSIRSPQFVQAEWSYIVHLTNHSNLIITSDTSSSHNKFVELAVRESLKLSLALQGVDRFVLDHESVEPQGTSGSREKAYHVTIDILGDNDFYSQPRHSDATITPFRRLNTSLKDVHKTGLGSSAAMATSLCSAILLHFTPSIAPKSILTKLLLHNLSQYVHSLAQGKVGSGFDVSAALWGTHVYIRFSPSCIAGLLDANNDQNQEITPRQLRENLDPSINLAWTDPSTAPIIEQFSIPKYTTLLLADVDAGSHTPSMVAQVLKWKTSQNEIATKIWNELSIKNDQLKLSFRRLEELWKMNEQDYLSHVMKLSNDPYFHSQDDSRPLSETDNVGELFVKISSLTKSIRKLMKIMGNESNVPIEPESQTELLDECEKLDGVIGTGVPGAGGYDAIWVLVFTPPLPMKTELNKEEKSIFMTNLIGFLNNWSHSSVRVLSSDSWVIGGSRSSTCQIDGKEEEDGDGIQIFDNILLVDRLKSQSHLFSSST